MDVGICDEGGLREEGSVSAIDYSEGTRLRVPMGGIGVPRV